MIIKIFTQHSPPDNNLSPPIAKRRVPRQWVGAYARHNSRVHTKSNCVVPWTTELLTRLLHAVLCFLWKEKSNLESSENFKFGQEHLNNF